MSGLFGLACTALLPFVATLCLSLRLGGSLETLIVLGIGFLTVVFGCACDVSDWHGALLSFFCASWVYLGVRISVILVASCGDDHRGSVGAFWDRWPIWVLGPF